VLVTDRIRTRGWWSCAALLALCSLRSLPIGAAVAADVGPLPHWIWATDHPPAGDTVRLGRSFSVPAVPDRVELSLLADERGVVFLNGVRVGEVRGTAEFQRFDRSVRLRPGENRIEVEADGGFGMAAVLVRCGLHYADGSEQVLVSDPSWEALDGPAHVWRPVVSRGLLGVQPWGEPPDARRDYYQWREARGTGRASAAAGMQTIPGFRVELIRSSEPGEGSWVSLAVDPQGRITIGREGPGILRLTLPTTPEETPVVEVINDTLEECRGLLYAHGALYVNANNSRGFYRLQDRNGEDRFETVELLRATGGGIGHGRNGLALAPDGAIHLIHGNDVHLPADFEGADSPVRNYGVDRLQPCDWDRYLFDREAKLPAGHVVRTDQHGHGWELLDCGLRNPVGLDFSPEGECFTFDADNEGDIGLPWYRPTRVNHLVPGADFGWRQGSGNRPAYYPDSWPTTIDIGKASPTAVKFGIRSRFPEPYRRALFLLDWAYGRILAVHLRPTGASYTGTVETFLTGKPLNVTGLDFGSDGAMYFTTGGRGTQSGLYRVTCELPEKAMSAWRFSHGGRLPDRTEIEQAAAARRTRRKLERHQRSVSAEAIDTAWPLLDSADIWLRHAARLALERQPVATWRERALAETRPTAALTALLALARSDDASSRDRLIDRVLDFPLDQLDATRQLLAIRTVQLAIARMGSPAADKQESLRERLEPHFPTPFSAVNHLLLELLVALDSPQAVQRSIPWLTRGRSQEDSLIPLFLLRNVRAGWTPAARDAYFAALARASGIRGGRDVTTFLIATRTEALRGLPVGERSRYAELVRLATDTATNTVVTPHLTAPNRRIVKQWQMADLTDLVQGQAAGNRGDLARGAAIFRDAQCAQCHRLGAQGRSVGPDLDSVGRRFGPRDLLEQILVPSKVIDPKFQTMTFLLTSGRVVSGRPVSGNDESVLVLPDPLSFDTLIEVARDEIEEETLSHVSPMPAGLLDPFTAEEILDLLAYLAADGVVPPP